MRQIPLKISLLLVLVLLACTVPAELSAPIGGVQPTSTATQTLTPTPTSTPTPASRWPTRIVDFDNLRGIGLRSWQDTSDEVLAAYYQSLPPMFEGYATRFGRAEFTEDVMWRHMLEIQDQLDHAGYSFIGGGSGFVTFDGERLMLDDRASMAWTRIVYGERPDKVGDVRGLNNALYLYDESFGRQDMFKDHIRQEYDGVVATKSPNDFGRELCLITGHEPHTKAARVVVGDYARRIDWIPNEVDDDPLGLRVYTDPDGKEWDWAIELPNHLFDYLLKDDAVVVVVASMEYCYSTLLTPPK